MPTYLYCILPANAAEPGIRRGIGSEPVRSLRVESVIAWVTDLNGPLTASVDSTELATLHDHVVGEAVSRGITPIPARAGQSFPDDARIVERLSRCAAALAQELQRLHGLVEMSIVASLTGDPDPILIETGGGRRARTGRAYLQARSAHEHAMHDLQTRAAGTAHALTQSLGTQFIRKTSSPRLDGRRRPRVAVSHLIPRDSIDAYRRAVARANIDGLGNPVVSGPSAPYSFTGLDICK